MRRVLGVLILTLLASFLAVRADWLGIIVALFGACLAFGLQPLNPSRPANLGRNFFRFLALYLPLAILCGMLFGGVLFDHREALARPGLIGFLFGSNLLKIYWAGLFGLAVAAAPFVVTLGFYGAFAAQMMYSTYEQHRGHRLQAALSAVMGFIGIGKGTWLVINGELRSLNGSNDSFHNFGGPAVLIVQEGFAVILERGGELARILGRGITWLGPMERISMIVPLRMRSEHTVIHQVSTKDQLMIDEFEVWVFHKVDPGPEDERVENGLYPYNRDILLKRVWSTDGADWRGGVKAIIDSAVRDVVGRYDLGQILPISDAFRVTFKDDLRQQINRVTKDAMGVDVIVADIGQIKVPEEAEKKLLEKWLADQSIIVARSEREAAIRKGEGEAAVLRIKEEAWAQAQKKLILDVVSGFRSMNAKPEEIRYIIAIRALETLEQMAADPATKILLPLDALTQLSQLRQVVNGANYPMALP